MITTYRIFKPRYSTTWFDDEATYRFGGRWSSRGTKILYTSGSLSLGALEMLVCLNNEKLLSCYSYATINFDEDLILRVEDFRNLPENWHNSPSSFEIQNIGDDWAAKQASVVMRVPSSIIPVEFNYLINVGHPEISKVRLGNPKDFKN